MQVDARGRKQIRSVAHWMLAILCVLFIDVVVVLLRLVDDLFEGVVLLVLSVWVSVSAARAGYWLSRPLSPENLRRGLLGVRSFFRATLVSALINAVLAAFSGADVTWTPIRDRGGANSAAKEQGEGEARSGADAEGRAEGERDATFEQLEGLLIAMLSSCQDHTSDRCTEALFRAGSPVGAFKSMPGGFLRADVGRRCRKANFARVEFEATYRGKESKERAVALFVRDHSGKWAFLALDKAPLRSAPFECDEPPYHDAGDARSELESLAVDWTIVDDAHSIDLSPFRLHNCAIDEIKLEIEGERSPWTIDTGCWVEDGFTFDKEDSKVELPSPAPSKVLLRVSFVDGSTSSWGLSNPAGRGESGMPDDDPKPASPPSGYRMNRALVMGAGGGQVFLDGVLQCDAPCEIRVPVGDGVSHEVRVRKAGEDDRVVAWRPKSVVEPLPPLRRSSESSSR